jgi:hypothetical protein
MSAKPSCLIVNISGLGGRFRNLLFLAAMMDHYCAVEVARIMALRNLEALVASVNEGQRCTLLVIDWHPTQLP